MNTNLWHLEHQAATLFSCKVNFSARFSIFQCWQFSESIFISGKSHSELTDCMYTIDGTTKRYCYYKLNVKVGSRLFNQNKVVNSIIRQQCTKCIWEMRAASACHNTNNAFHSRIEAKKQPNEKTTQIDTAKRYLNLILANASSASIP